MATFLVTPRMNPALRARVERAVSHRERARHHAAKLHLSGPFASGRRMRLARVLPLVALLLVVGLGSLTYVREQRAFEGERASLLAAMEARRAGLPPGHEGFLAQVDPWIDEAAAAEAPPDAIDPALREPGALDAWLGRPAVYVRGDAAELRAVTPAPAPAPGLPRPATRGDAEEASIKDAFLTCLMLPPPSASERDLLLAVKGVYFGGSIVDDQTIRVRRLAEARGGLRVLGADFEAAVRAAEEPLALKRLRKELEAAPVESAAKAAAAELLILVADEPAVTGARAARVTLVDLTSNRPLVRVRVRVPSAGRSATAALYREHLEGCALALAARGSVEEE